MKKITIFVALILFIALLPLVACTSSVAEGFRLYDLTDSLVKLDDYKGEPVILFFWATWCPSCRDEIAELNEMYPEIQKAGIHLFSIDLQEKKKTIRKYLKANPIDFRVLRDIDGSVAYSYGLIGIPTYVLIDKNGKEYHRNRLPKNYKELLLVD